MQKYIEKFRKFVKLSPSSQKIVLCTLWTAPNFRKTRRKSTAKMYRCSINIIPSSVKFNRFLHQLETILKVHDENSNVNITFQGPQRIMSIRAKNSFFSAYTCIQSERYKKNFSTQQSRISGVTCTSTENNRCGILVLFLILIHNNESL